MKKTQVDAILVNQKKKRTTIIIYLCEIVFLLALACVSFYFILDSKKVQYVTYKETSNVDYNVYLKPNYVFEKPFLPKNQRYIANLINYISTNFKYEISLDKNNVDYQYSYRVEATLDIKDGDKKGSLYNKTDILIPEEQHNSSSNNIKIDKSIQIDFNKYNNFASAFVKMFEIADTNSTLTVNMYVNMIGSCEEFENDERKENVLSLTIPLNERTLGIEVSNNLLTTDEKVMLCNKSKDYSIVYIIYIIIIAILEIIIVFNLIKFINKSRTAESVYDKELKKILNNYKSYIQKINNGFDLTGYQLLKVDTFTDMLEIRDTLQQPILMVESSKGKGVHFIITSNTKVLYTYSLRLKDIESEMNEENINKTEDNKNG